MARGESENVGASSSCKSSASGPTTATQHGIHGHVFVRISKRNWDMSIIIHRDWAGNEWKIDETDYALITFVKERRTETYLGVAASPWDMSPH